MNFLLKAFVNLVNRLLCILSVRFERSTYDVLMCAGSGLPQGFPAKTAVVVWCDVEQKDVGHIPIELRDDVDYAQLVKIYGTTPEAEKRYSPAECIAPNVCSTASR